MIKVKGLSTTRCWCLLIVHLLVPPLAFFVWLFKLGLCLLVQYLFDGENLVVAQPKQATILSPHPKPTTPPSLPLLLTWDGAHEIDGVPIQQLQDVSIRWERQGFEEHHVQGILYLEHWSDRLHRLRYNGNFSIRDPVTGSASKGDEVKGTIYLPVDVHYVVQVRKFVSEKSKKKIYGLRLDFGENDDALRFVQLAIPLGASSNTKSLALRFQAAVERALSGVDESASKLPLLLGTTA